MTGKHNYEIKGFKFEIDYDKKDWAQAFMGTDKIIEKYRRAIHTSDTYQELFDTLLKHGDGPTLMASAFLGMKHIIKELGCLCKDCTDTSKESLNHKVTEAVAAAKIKVQMEELVDKWSMKD